MFTGVDQNAASEKFDAGGFVIMRVSDARAIMAGTNAVEIRWGYDFSRVRRHSTLEEAHDSWEILIYSEDEAVICPAYYWEQIWLNRLDAHTQRRQEEEEQE